MTVKELAEFTGKTERTIRNWIKKALENISVTMENTSVKLKGDNREVDYSLNDIESILLSGSLSTDAVFILIQYARRESDFIPATLESSESSLTKKDLEMIGVIVGHVMNNMEMRVSNIEHRIEDRKALLPPPEMEPRQQLKKIVNEYVGRTGCNFRDSWNDLYREFNYYYHLNVHTASKNRGMKIIDYIDTELEMVDKLLSVAVKLFADGQLI